MCSTWLFLTFTHYSAEHTLCQPVNILSLRFPSQAKVKDLLNIHLHSTQSMRLYIGHSPSIDDQFSRCGRLCALIVAEFARLPCLPTGN